MRLRALIITLAATLGTAGGLALAAPAQAQSQNLHDAAGDVLVGALDFGCDDRASAAPTLRWAAGTARATCGADSDGVVDPTVTDGDVLAVRVAHTRRQIVFLERFRDIARPARGSEYDFYVRGSNGIQRIVEVQTTHAKPAGRVTVLRASNFRKVRCHASQRINYATNTMVVRVPRACVHNARKVRASAANGSFYLTGEVLHFQQDSAFAAPTIESQLGFTHWLKRG